MTPTAETGFRSVCLLSDVPPMTARRVMVDGVAIAIVHAEDGVHAINDRCSHADVSLADGEVDGCAIECWLHGSAFDLRTGSPLTPPAVLSVPIYPTRIVGEGEDALIEVDPTPVPRAAAND